MPMILLIPSCFGARIYQFKNYDQKPYPAPSKTIFTFVVVPGVTVFPLHTRERLLHGKLYPAQRTFPAVRRDHN